MKIIFLLLLPLVSLFPNLAYIGTPNTVYVVDTAANNIAAAYQGISAGQIAITPDDRYVYVTENATNSVAVIDRTTSNVVTINDPSFNNNIGIAITPNGQFAYVTNYNSGTVSVISVATEQVVGAPISGFTNPWGIAITPDGQFAYVANGSGFVSVIRLSDNTLLAPTITVGNGSVGIAITPDGRYAYVANENSNSVSVIRLSDNATLPDIPVGLEPFEVAVSPDSQFVYVANNAYSDLTQSSISVISTALNEVVDLINLYPSSSGPSGLTVTPDGQTLYVANTKNAALIPTSLNEVTGYILQGIQTTCIAITSELIPKTLISHLTGYQRIDDFGVTYEYFNHLEWQGTPNSGVIGYNVYRNGEKIAVLNASTFQYNDHNRKKNISVTYAVAPIQSSGQEGTPLEVVVR